MNLEDNKHCRRLFSFFEGLLAKLYRLRLEVHRAEQASKRTDNSKSHRPMIAKNPHRKWSSSFGVAANILGQLARIAATGKWPPPCAEDTKRGIDFYSWKEFVPILIKSAVKFNATHGYVPRLASPTNFSEHIFVRKFFAPLPMPSLADKLTAQDYVKARLGDDFLPKVAWVGDEISEFVTAKLPAGRYVLKANHGCNCNIILNLPDDLTAKRQEIEDQTTRWLAQRFGYTEGEWQYCTFKPKLFLEEFIDFNGDQTPDDYKFFCFHGKAYLIEIDVDRFARLRSAFYTRDWKRMPVAYRHPPIERARPHNLEDMIRVAEAIAEKMEFARVDLYSDRKSRIRFGEVTFTPGNALSRFSDVKFDRWLGAQFARDSGNNMPLDY
jgi:hypothetical protein